MLGQKIDEVRSKVDDCKRDERYLKKVDEG